MDETIIDTCYYVADGDTFVTLKETWIRLARVHAPAEGKAGYNAAKNRLSDLVLNKTIIYKKVGTSYNRIVAEVWHNDNNINDIMILAGYSQ